jgi:hypothetical protein
MFHLLSLFLDARDARFAGRLREDYGARGWLISWERRGDARWVARLSCPAFPETVTRRGRTRCHAARRAEQALRLLLSEDDPPEPGIDPRRCPHRT